MPVLYVTQPGAEIRKKAERLVVEFRAQALASVPLRDLERVVLLGPAQVSAGAAQALMQQQIPVVYCSTRGRFHGSLSPGSQDAELMLAQVAAHNHAEYHLSIAQTIVDAKITHQQRLLRRHARNHPNPRLDGAIETLGQFRTRIPTTPAVPEAMGIEGQTSAVYFAVFGECLRQEGVSFNGRNRRPARDCVNSTLNLGYMVNLGEVHGALLAQGLHPGLGFLHATSRRHAALSLDMLELLRQPVVDRLTLSLFNRGALTPEDFSESESHGVRFKEASLKRYLEFYERVMTTPFRDSKGQTTTLRKWLFRQCELLRKAILEFNPWEPEVLEL